MPVLKNPSIEGHSDHFPEDGKANGAWVVRKIDATDAFDIPGIADKT